MRCKWPGTKGTSSVATVNGFRTRERTRKDSIRFDESELDGMERTNCVYWSITEVGAKLLSATLKTPLKKLAVRLRSSKLFIHCFSRQHLLAPFPGSLGQKSVRNELTNGKTGEGPAARSGNLQ